MPFYSRPASKFVVKGPRSEKEMYQQQWGGYYGNSTRVNGRLHLGNNRCNLYTQKLLFYTETPSQSGFLSSRSGATNGMSPPDSLRISADNIAYARWRGKLHKGGASLGVSLGSYKQSRSMIVDRLAKAGNALDHAATALQNNPSRRAKLRLKRRRKELLADDILEYKFGWMPLFEDIHAAMTTICSQAVPPQWVKGRGHAVGHEYLRSDSGYIKYSDYATYQVITTYGARVDIQNENLWLLNRMGLINPATVIWDLVPWSFVVNMFVNVNSMINCVTDTVGLNISEPSITRTGLTHCHTIDYGYAGLDTGMVYHALTEAKWKDRDPGRLLYPVLETKIPDFNWDLAVTAGALVLQKVKKIGSLIGI